MKLTSMEEDSAEASATNKRSFGRVVAARVAPIRSKVRHLFDRALKPAHQSDPDPGNAVPFAIRRDIGFYRASFYAYVVLISTLVLTVPRTFAYDAETGTLLPGKLWFGITMLFLVLLQHWSVCGSDPGYIPNDLAANFGEEHLQHQEDSDDEEAQKIVLLPSRLHTKAQAYNYVLQSPTTTPPPLPLAQQDEEDEDEGMVVVLPEDDDEDMEEEESTRLLLTNRGTASNKPSIRAAAIPAYSSDEEEDATRNVRHQATIVSTHDVDDDVVIPIRAKFCKTSKLVVATYDHHCQVLNTTIGERNRARFWLLLLWSTLALMWALDLTHSGFRAVSLLNPKYSWFDINAHVLFAFVLVAINLAIIGGLFLFHTFLMLANVTSHEFLRADKLPYLKGTKDFDLPFSMGMRENVIFYFTSDSAVMNQVNRILRRQTEWKPHLWQKPNPAQLQLERNSSDVWKHPWSNKYYSCC